MKFPSVVWMRHAVNENFGGKGERKSELIGILQSLGIILNSAGAHRKSLISTINSRIARGILDIREDSDVWHGTRMQQFHLLLSSGGVSGCLILICTNRHGYSLTSTH